MTGRAAPSPRLLSLWLFRRLARLLLLAALAFAAPGAAPAGADGELARANRNREAFLSSPDRPKLRANWLALIEEYEKAALAQEEPRHASRARAWGADLALTSGRRFKQAADLEKADQLARRAVRDCPRCGHAAEAQFISGQALFDLKRLDQAVKQLLKVELNYPDSPLAESARRLLDRIHGRRPPPRTAPKGAPAPKEAPASKGAAAPKETAAPKRPAAPKAASPPPPPPRADGLAQVYFLRLEDQGPVTTVTAYLDRTTAYLYNLIPPAAAGGSFRAYADLKNTVLAPGVRTRLPDRSPLVGLVKMSQLKKDTVRLVLDLPRDHPYRPTFLDKPPRLVFQVARAAADLKEPAAEAPPEPAPAPARSQPGSAAAAARRPSDSLARQLGLKVRTVVLDPGHGGKDAGASGFGLKEKDLVLKLGLKLADRLRKRLGLTVWLTRGDDTFLTLARRTRIAKEKKADLFISLHVNANPLARVQGLETYILNFATDRSAMAVAARENAAADKSMAELQDILQILAKNTKIAESAALAQTLHKAAVNAVAQAYGARDLGVKEAPFFVLVGTESPAVLMEIGFITNEKEAARLAEDNYLNRLADGLTKGLESYLKGL